MRVYFILFFALNIFCKCNSQMVRFCGYEALHNKTSKISIENIKIKNTVQKYYLKSVGKNDSLIEKYEVVLDKKIKLIHRFPTLATKMATMDTELDSLFLFNSSFCIQKLLNDTITINPEIRKAYYLYEGQEKFLLIEGAYADDRERSNIHWVLVFNITNTNKIKFLRHDFESNVFAFSNKYLGDFNNDGLIDFCFLSNDSIRVYNIKEDRLVELNNYFLTLNHKDSFYYIDLKKSKWFYDINSNKNSCRNTSEKPRSYNYPDYLEMSTQH